MDLQINYFCDFIDYNFFKYQASCYAMICTEKNRGIKVIPLEEYLYDQYPE